jgi:molybdate transport system substrate-binding protein
MVALRMFWSLGVALSLLALAGTEAHAAELRVLLANAVKEPLQELLPEFEQRTGHKVVLLGTGTEAAAKRVRDGEVFDVVLIGSDRLDELLKAGALIASSRRDFSRSGVGIAVPAGAPKPDVSTTAAVRQAVLDARSVALSAGPSGQYVERMLERLGVAGAAKDKLVRTPSGVQVADLLARGDAQLGFQQVSELIHARGITYLGPLPAEIQNTTVYTAAIHPSSRAPNAARALLEDITGARATAILKRHGMEPG